MDNSKKESFSEEIDRLMKESEEREKKMTPDELKSLKAARQHHSRKVRSEILGYDDCNSENKKEDTEDTQR